MKALAIFIAAICGLGVLLMVALHVWVYSAIWISSRRLRVELHRRQRTISRKEVRQRIEKNEGIILCEAPTMGWNVVRLWWSPSADFVPRRELDEREELVLKDDIENHRRYIDLDTGSAYLVDGFVFTQLAKRYLKKHFGKEEAPFIFTGAVLFAQAVKNRKGKTPNQPPGPTSGLAPGRDPS